jgi:hypothetical protein
MGLFRASRDNYGPDRFFYPKVALFSIGGAIGIAGMTSGRDWLVAIAIVVVGFGVLLRFVGRRRD